MQSVNSAAPSDWDKRLGRHSLVQSVSVIVLGKTIVLRLSYFFVVVYELLSVGMKYLYFCLIVSQLFLLFMHIWALQILTNCKISQSIYVSNSSVWKSLMFDGNTWKHITVCKLFELRTSYLKLFSSDTITFTFRQILLGKVWTHFYFQLWAK